MTEEIKRIDIKEFRAKGFLQEANRQFFHPLGLALEVIIEENGDETLGGIWDYRDDAEGMFFGNNMINGDRIKYVQEIKDSKSATRSIAARDYDFRLDDDGIQIPRMT